MQAALSRPTVIDSAATRVAGAARPAAMSSCSRGSATRATLQASSCTTPAMTPPHREIEQRVAVGDDVGDGQGEAEHRAGERDGRRRVVAADQGDLLVGRDVEVDRHEYGEKCDGGAEVGEKVRQRGEK